MKTLNFERSVSFLGRNGGYICAGLDLSGRDNFDLTISPITSRGTAGKCYIQVPAENVVDVVNALKEMYPEKFQDQDELDLVSNYLCDGEDDDGNEVPISQQIKLIRNHKDIHALIDDIDGVSVWEPISGRYTVRRFVKEILN